MKIVHMVMWLTEAVLYMYGVVSLLWGKPSLCVLDQMSLEPFVAEFWRNTGFHMAGHTIATIGYRLMIIPILSDLCSGCLPP